MKKPSYEKWLGLFRLAKTAC